MPAPELPSLFRQNIQTTFKDGAAWIESLPALVSDCEERWGISTGKPFPLSYSFVAPGVRVDGSAVVLKIAVPNPELQTEIAALQLYAGGAALRQEQCAVRNKGATRTTSLMRNTKAAVLWLVLAALPLLADQQATSEELKQAEADVPLLTQVLELKPGMTVADVGAGFGATTIVLSKWLGPAGRLYATDIAEIQLRVLREAVVRERLDNVHVLEGAIAQTNLPDACCDAILMRDIYHHLTVPDDFNRSVLAP